jgi:hypothetical protein
VEEHVRSIRPVREVADSESPPFLMARRGLAITVGDGSLVPALR